jgi:hypothetical protein
MKRLFVTLIALGFLVGTTTAENAAEPRGAELLVPFKMELKSALTAGMAEGPVAAISVCRDQAPQIAESLSTGEIRMGRTSHRLRNPENATPGWVTPVLDGYLDQTGSRKPRTVTIDQGREGYVEPILIQPVCLTCHGPALADDVAARIAELYPDDRAVGFREGDFRGVFWVEYPVEP